VKQFYVLLRCNITAKNPILLKNMNTWARGQAIRFTSRHFVLFRVRYYPARKKPRHPLFNHNKVKSSI
jgi:hypothetical protein